MAAVTGSTPVEFIKTHEDHLGNKVANIAAPEDAADAATKQYVDGRTTGAYTPATVGDWEDPAPTTVAGALDSLAARVKALEDAA